MFGSCSFLYGSTAGTVGPLSLYCKVGFHGAFSARFQSDLAPRVVPGAEMHFKVVQFT